MDIYFLLFCSFVFLGLQGVWKFSRPVSLTLILCGNGGLLIWALLNGDGLIFTITGLMTIAQFTRIYPLNLQRYWVDEKDHFDYLEDNGNE